MRISDWSSDVFSSYLAAKEELKRTLAGEQDLERFGDVKQMALREIGAQPAQGFQCRCLFDTFGNDFQIQSLANTTDRFDDGLIEHVFGESLRVHHVDIQAVDRHERQRVG